MILFYKALLKRFALQNIRRDISTGRTLQEVCMLHFSYALSTRYL